MGNSYFVTPSVFQDAEAASDEGDKTELNAQCELITSCQIPGLQFECLVREFP